MEVANERDFYRLKELSKKEIEIVTTLALEDAPEPLKEILSNFISIFTGIFYLREQIKSSGKSDRAIENKIEESIVNTEEDLHANIEKMSGKYIDSLLSHNAGFFDIESDRIDFSYFLCVQYLRTKNEDECTGSDQRI